MVRQIGLFVECKSASRRLVDTPHLQTLPKDLADCLTPISEGDGNNEDDRVACPTSTNKPPTKSQRRVDW